MAADAPVYGSGVASTMKLLRKVWKKSCFLLRVRLEEQRKLKMVSPRGSKLSLVFTVEKRKLKMVGCLHAVGG